MTKRYRALAGTLFILALLLTTLLLVTVAWAQQQGSISGRVYCDANYNYSYDAGEEVAGVAVTLYNDAECDYIPDSPAAGSQDTAADGTYAFADLTVGGATWGERVCYVVEADQAAPELGACNYIDWNPHSVYLYGNLVDWANENFRFVQIWAKTVDGQTWVPDMSVTAETSDTIEVVDVVFLPRVDLDRPAQIPQVALIETWNPDELSLVDAVWDDFTDVVSASGKLTWTIDLYQSPAPTATITKTFHVEPCTWTETTLQEDLYWAGQGKRLVLQEPIDQRPVVVHKTQPVLWIDSTYDSEVSPGETANFTLSYGNNGGFENVAWIRNEFPPEAPFDSSNPAPDQEAGDGSWVEWDLGSLSTGDGGSIDVTVAIQAGLSPSTTMVITDSIYNHAEQVADSTQITFHILQPPLSLGDLVWYDTNQNGIQDSGEPGVPGIVVDLYARDCGGQAMASDTTDATGNYLFADLNNGIYCLQFSSIPADWSISPQNQGSDDAVDSDVDPATRQITDINLTETDLDEDMGLYAAGSIGDVVFCDANYSGGFDAGEGVGGVAVTLYDDLGCDGVAGNQLSQQDSAADGGYLFGGLRAGLGGSLPVCYVVEVDGTDNDLGNCDAPITPLSYAVALDTDNLNDLDNDFGFQQQMASIGDLAWNDSNEDGIQDTGETGIADVTVTLYGCGERTQEDTTITDADGLYSFDDQPAGYYYLAFVPPLGYESSPQNQGSDPALDSDPDPLTGETICFYFDGRQDDLTWDAGFYQPEPPPTPPPSEEPPVVPEASTLVLLGGAISGLAGYIGLQYRARRRR